MSSDKKATILPVGKTERGFHGLVKRGESVAVMEFVPSVEGKPFMGSEYATVSDVPDSPFLEAEFHPVPQPSTVGPSKVNSEAYKAGWERIFGSKAGEA